MDPAQIWPSVDAVSGHATVSGQRASDANPWPRQTARSANGERAGSSAGTHEERASSSSVLPISHGLVWTWRVLPVFKIWKVRRQEARHDLFRCLQCSR